MEKTTLIEFLQKSSDELVAYFEDRKVSYEEAIKNLDYERPEIDLVKLTTTTTQMLYDFNKNSMFAKRLQKYVKNDFFSDSETSDILKTINMALEYYKEIQ